VRNSLLWLTDATLTKGDDLLHVAAEQIRTIYTLGVGDVWHAAYCYGLVNNFGLKATVEFADVSAAIKWERLSGRLGVPMLSEVKDRLVRHRN
jgi:sulfofructose kinase